MNSSKPDGGTAVKGTRVPLPDGRWVVMRPLRGADLVAMSGGDVGELLQRLDSAVIDKSWDGDLLEEEWDAVLRPIMRGWRTGSEDDAVPPASDGASPSP